MKKHRMARVAEMIREVASETILFKLSDPRVKRVTVMRAEVSPDLQHARVYVSVMGTPAEQAKTLRGLQHAAGFIQAQLGDRMRSRYTPSLRFILDQGVKQSVEISRLIAESLPKSDEVDAELDSQDQSDDTEFDDGEEELEEELDDEEDEAEAPESPAPSAKDAGSDHPRMGADKDPETNKPGS